jgi:hypothetical protein
MQVRQLFPLLFVASTIGALTACPSNSEPTVPPVTSHKFVFAGPTTLVNTYQYGEPLALWSMTVTPTSYSYTLAHNFASPSGTGVGSYMQIAPNGTVGGVVYDSVAKTYATANLSDMFANKRSSFGCSGSVSVSQDTKIAVFDRLDIAFSSAKDTTRYLTFDRTGPNGTTPVHHLLFYALGPGKAFGTTSCSISGAGGSGAVTSTTTTDITIKPGWNLYADSAASSTSSFETIVSYDTTYNGPYVAH